MIRRSLFVFFSFLTLFARLQADNAAWTNSSGSFWDDDSNWTAPFPNGVDAIAGFVGVPTSTPTVNLNETTSITVGSLIFDSTLDPIINFTNGQLIFETSVGNAQIFSSGAGGAILNTNVVLNSNLNIFVDGSQNLSISANIGGSGSLSLYGSASTGLTLSGTNSFGGGTFVVSGNLKVNNINNALTIPGDITVYASGSVSSFKNNHYADSTVMTVDGGSVDLLGTTQSMDELIVNDSGLFTDTHNSGTLNLLAATGSSALVVGTDGLVNPFLINLINGGDISYDATNPGPGFIAAPTIDLQTNSVNFDVPHNFYNCIDTNVNTTVFQNGTLNKTGDGVVLFEGGTVPTFNIEDGTVVIGDQEGTETITATGVVTVTSPGALAGFQTLNSQMGVVNSGTVEPGNGCSGCSTTGTLTIQGNYTQTSSGVLSIKALNSGSADLLTVNAGAVVLNGQLNFEALPGAVFSNGDQIVVINNTNESTPISGTFASFTYNLPPDLQATVVYNNFQVLVEISTGQCPPCPPCTPCPPQPPSNFIGVVIKDKFLNTTNCILEAHWQPSPSPDVVLYRIYKNKHLVDTVLATSPLIFIERNLRNCSVEGFTITAVNSNNAESGHIPLIKSEKHKSRRSHR